MAITKSFKLAELIRHIEYDSTNDIISTNKGFKDKKKKDATTKTATTQFALDTFLRQILELDISLQCLKELTFIRQR